MQLPRGNLEAVRPRALVLPAVAAALDGGDYASAWALCAANRLDLNLLVGGRGGGGGAGVRGRAGRDGGAAWRGTARY